MLACSKCIALKPPTQACLLAGLFAHDLDITGVKVDGEDVEFEQRMGTYEQQGKPEGKHKCAHCMLGKTSFNVQHACSMHGTAFSYLS